MEVTAKGSQERQEAASQGPAASGAVPILGLRDIEPSKISVLASALTRAHTARHYSHPTSTTHRDTVAIGVSHHFVLNFLPPLQGLIYQHLAGMRKSWGHKSRELLPAGGKARAQATQGKGCTNQHRIPQPLSSCLGL